MTTKTKKRIYVVNGNRLVEAYGPQSARNHVAKDTITSELANQHTLVELLKKGVAIEGTEQPEQTDFTEKDRDPE